MRSRGKQETAREESRRASTCSSFSLIWHTVFYSLNCCPTVNSAKQFAPVQYIFIDFNAWEYVGCDHTWAGLVTMLVDEIESRYRILLSFFRIFGEIETGESFQTEKLKWVCKQWSKIFFFSIPCLFLVLAAVIVLLWQFMQGNFLTSMGYAFLAVSSIAACPFLLPVTTLLFTLKGKLRRAMNRKDLSSQLGFMNTVKEEVESIMKFLQFTSCAKQREIRVIMKITNLDLCAPDKVVAVLDAINILLSGGTAPFISILAADPSILVDCIQQSSNTFSNGYLYLDRIITLPFSIPPMSHKRKLILLSEILKLEKGSHSLRHILNLEKESSRSNQRQCSGEDNGTKSTTFPFSKEEQKKEIFQYLGHMDSEYLPRNSRQMSRVVNTVLTILSMFEMGFKPREWPDAPNKVDKKLMEEIIDWVILANHWPCRLSWLLQCEEDDRQQRDLTKIQEENRLPQESAGMRNGDGNQWEQKEEQDAHNLLDFYEKPKLELENIKKLDNKKEKIQKLLELDGDPDLFRKFLGQRKSNFTVEQARFFSNFLINLDFSLRRQFELIRNLKYVKKSENSLEPSSRE